MIGESAAFTVGFWCVGGVLRVTPTVSNEMSFGGVAFAQQLERISTNLLYLEVTARWVMKST